LKNFHAPLFDSRGNFLRTTRCVSFFSEILADPLAVTVMNYREKIISARFALVDFDARIASFNDFHLYDN
jgi:hypothetical protein